MTAQHDVFVRKVAPGYVAQRVVRLQVILVKLVHHLDLELHRDAAFQIPIDLTVLLVRDDQLGGRDVVRRVATRATPYTKDPVRAGRR